MKNFSIPLAFACVTLALTSATAIAGPMESYNTSVYNFKDNDSGNPLKFLSTTGTQSYSDTFNLLDSGFNPTTMKITAARITFAFADDGDSGSEYVSVYLEGALWNVTSGVEIDGNHTNQPNNFDYFYQTWSASNQSDLAFLNNLQDGILTYKVKVTTGDVYLKIAQLEVTAVTTSKVPESGATAGLLGTALIGIEAYRRRCRQLARMI